MMVADTSVWGDIPTWCGLVGAGVAFSIGLLQYRKSQAWKKAEFIAPEMKQFFADDRVAAALTMIDWCERRIALPFGQGIVFITRERLAWALQPDKLLPDGEKTQAVDAVTDQQLGFSAEDAAIRDCFDAFLDGLERFASYVRGGLIRVEDLRPYLGYWVDDIHSATDDK